MAGVEEEEKREIERGKKEWEDVNEHRCWKLKIWCIAIENLFDIFCWRRMRRLRSHDKALFIRT